MDSWMRQWLCRKNIYLPSGADSGPTAAIRCIHGKLMPEQAPGAKRVLVSESLWDLIHQIARTVKPDDPEDCSTFPSDSEECALCSVAIREAAFSEDSLRLSKHRKLVERSPELCWKRCLISQKSAATDELTIIVEDDWKLLCEEWGGSVSKCISARIEIDSRVGDKMIASYEEMPLSEEHISVPDEVNMSFSRRLLVKTYPQVCEECIGERESSELMKKLNYINEDICVCFVRGKEPSKSILEGSGSISDPSRRTSKQSRKASTAIYPLKMMKWESFGV